VPNKTQHLLIAKSNELFFASLDLTDGAHRGWASTVAFYAALHYIEAFFFVKGRHSPDHRTRDGYMIQFTETMNIYDDFCELKAISTRARYHGRYPDRNDFKMQVMPAFENVKAEMLKHC
jgi:hypothetical protein